MKNFRKVLALVLVVATLFSFVAMASAKSLADYKDNADVSYDEAVAVLSSIGILNGYEDDTFKPTNTITRAEMAKMIAVLANAGYDVSELYASACDFADSKDNWAASYIAYCAQTGIVAGRSATTFDPYGKVTGLETAKMLLVVLGFDAEKQGYVGADWKVNVLRDAKLMGLTNNFAAGYDIDAAITREEAAQMMLNALEAPAVVGYISENIIDVTNALIYKEQKLNYTGKLVKVLSYATLKDALVAGSWAVYDNAVISDDVLGEVLFGLKRNTVAAIDCYGRPGITWSYKNAKGTTITVGTFYNGELVKTASTAVNLVDLLKEEFAVGTYSLDAYVDGQLIKHLDTYNGAEDKTWLDGFDGTYTGNGVLTEVYVNDVEKTINIVVINTYLGTVATVQKASNDFTIAGTDLCFSNKGYDFAVGQKIWYWLCNANCGCDKDGKIGLHAAEVATPAEMTLTRTTTEPIAVLDGTSYKYAKDAADVMDVEEVKLANAGTTFDVYIDEYNYIKAWGVHTVAGPATEYAYVVENTGAVSTNGYAEDSKYFSYTASKDIVDFNADYSEDVAVTLATFRAMETAENNWAGKSRGALISYKTSGGKMSLVAEADYVESGYIEADGDIALTDANGNVIDTIHATKATKFLVRTWDYATKTYVYNAYNENELPYAIEGYKLYANGTAQTRNIQYFADTVNGADVATYVYVDAAFAKTSVTAYVTSYAKSVSDTNFVAQIGAYDEYNAYINGEAALLLVTQESALTVKPGIYTASLQCIGLYDNNVPVYAYISGPAAADMTGVDFIYSAAHDEIFVDGEAYDYTENFFGVVYNTNTNKVVKVLETVAELNDYVETAHAREHAAGCECATYMPGNAYVKWSGGDIAGLYLEVGTN